MSCFIQISDHVVFIPGERSASFPFCNSYLIKEKQELIAIDPQCGISRLKNAVASLGCALEDITAILNTHFHIDHSSASNWLSMKYSIPVYMHQRDAYRVTSWDLMCSEYMIRTPLQKQLFYKMFHDAGGFSPFQVSHVFTCDQALPLGIKPIHAPGHTPGHCCFEYKGFLFAGDIELNLPWVGNTSSSVADFIKTIKKLSEMEFFCLLPGHGVPCYKKIKETLQQYVLKFAEHEEILSNALSVQPKTIDEIMPFVRKLLPPSFRKKFNGEANTLPQHFERIANLQHLKHMESIGKAESFHLSDGQTLWTRSTQIN